MDFDNHGDSNRLLKMIVLSVRSILIVLGAASSASATNLGNNVEALLFMDRVWGQQTGSVTARCTMN